VTTSDPYGLVGQVLDGQFRVDAHIGEGGFSVVYRGTHLGLSEPIAIKCLKLPSALGSDLVESFVRRFRDESRIHYKLSQGNLHIVRSIASGTTTSPATHALVPYTVLEWLEGHSLADEFNRRRAAGTRGRPLREAVKLLDSAIDALAYAHAQGVVHRDLNPGNFFLAQTPSGTKLKILDFGVAKIMTDSALAMGKMARTVGNVRMFAPAYGAPEQFDDRVGAIGPWTDVYTIALVVLEVLTDRTVIEGEHLGEFARRALDPLDRPSPRTVGVPAGDETEKVFRHALALEPGRRPQDAGEFWGLLKHAMQVDVRSGRPAYAGRREGEGGPVTLRMRGSSPPDSSVASPSVPMPAVQRPSRPLGGTMRMDTRPGSASAWLAATPLPSVTVTTPVPPGPSARVSSAPPGTLSPLPVAPSALRTGYPGSGGAGPPVPYGSDRPPGVGKVPRPASRPTAQPARIIIAIVFVALALAGAATVGWHYWRAPFAAPAPAP
jgi:eukaryotic-like serine/threonine-protein kinase